MGVHSATAVAKPGPTSADAVTYAAAFQATAATVPDRVALRTAWDETHLTWAQYASAVEQTAGALAGLGVRRGDRVALLSRNRPELAIADVAAMHLGAATVALYIASTPRTVEYVLRDCRPRVLLLEEELRPRLAGVAHQVPVVALDTLASRTAAPGFDFEHAWHSVEGADDVAVLYTSGTTGQLKGVRWRHQEAIAAMRRFDLPHPGSEVVRDISAGPFAHLTERGAGHWRSLLRGSTRTFCPDPTQLGATLLEARPTYLFGPPRLWQTLRERLNATLNESERAAVDRAIARVREAGTRRSTTDDERVLAPLVGRIGLDHLTRALTAAAPCPFAIFDYFHALGIELGEFWGMTETSAATMTRTGGADLGTVGVPVPGYEIRLAQDDEILVRSDSMAVAYHDLPEHTAETFAADGWIHTGDIGALDGDGRLRIVDRKKEILIPDHGHNIAPAPIESELKCACPSIAHVCLIGDQRPHLAALIVLEEPELTQDTHARSAVDQAISQINSTLDPRERILSHAILSEPWSPGDELTETLKLRRRHIAGKYADTIDVLYSSAAATTPHHA
jgi:long-subunit acyl-CoA synthetase (AMP-forming)